jgi:hypothetical protein
MTVDFNPALDLTTLPARMQRLPVFRGFPVPWFVSTINGEPEFRVMDARKWSRAIAESRCWVCGEKLGHYRVFVIGPMCAVNRVTSEPPNHADCAEWSAKNCPFLSRPQMVRRDATELLEAGARDAAGVGLKRNPGVALLYWTSHYEVFRAQAGNAGRLISLGAPEKVRWFAEGREATRQEVIDSIASGLPKLRDACDLEQTPWRRRDAHALLERQLLGVSALYPD